MSCHINSQIIIDSFVAYNSETCKFWVKDKQSNSCVPLVLRIFWSRQKVWYNLFLVRIFFSRDSDLTTSVVLEGCGYVKLRVWLCSKRCGYVKGGVVMLKKVWLCCQSVCDQNLQKWCGRCGYVQNGVVMLP